MNTPVKDVMTTRVTWMDQDTPFTVIAAAFQDARVSAFPVLNRAARVAGVASEEHLPVTDTEGGLAGIVSRADILSAYSRRTPTSTRRPWPTWPSAPPPTTPSAWPCETASSPSTAPRTPPRPPATSPAGYATSKASSPSGTG
jgi:hypothetical protein